MIPFLPFRELTLYIYAQKIAFFNTILMRYLLILALFVYNPFFDRHKCVIFCFFNLYIDMFSAESTSLHIPKRPFTTATDSTIPLLQRTLSGNR